VRRLRVLITNNTLAERAGSELWVRDLATALLARGHAPIAFSTQLGEVAHELRQQTVPVIDRLDAIGAPLDLVHGHHHLETMTALLRFPGVPAVYVCHGWLPWQEAPPRFPSIRRYVAVDDTCRDRLVCEYGIPEAHVRVLLNFVDLARFAPRDPLPARPRRALVFSNAASEHTHLPAVREACTRAGVTVDALGIGSGTAAVRPEEVLAGYDVVFAKGRSALEALAVGAAVVLCDANGVGPLVMSGNFDRLRRLNFGVRVSREPVSPEVLAGELARYDAADAAAVARRVRAEAGREAAVDELIGIYREVLAEHAASPAPDPVEEARAASAYLRWLGPFLKAEMGAIEQRERLWARGEHARLAAERDRLGPSRTRCAPRRGGSRRPSAASPTSWRRHARRSTPCAARSPSAAATGCWPHRSSASSCAFSSASPRPVRTLPGAGSSRSRPRDRGWRGSRTAS